MAKKKQKATTTIKECHQGTIDIGSVIVENGNRLIISGGGHGKQLNLTNTDLLIDLASTVDDTIVLNKAAQANESLSKITNYTMPAIEISWRDYGIPALNKEFWHHLVSSLKAFATERKEKTTMVTFCCQGGHGRTGTALTIVGALLGLNKDDPVEWLRSIYCAKAVESETQIKYISNILQIPITAQPAKIPVIQTWAAKSFNEGVVTKSTPQTLPYTREEIDTLNKIYFQGKPQLA